VPLTVGGGVRTVEDVRNLLMSGADKVALNSAALEQPQLIGQASERFGSQCVVVSVDARRVDDRYEVWTRSGTHPTRWEVSEVCLEAQARGAGEILLTSIDRDGTMQGYDIELCHRVAEAVDIPVVAAGGCGTYEHMADVLRQTRVSAVAASSMYLFTQQTPLDAKRYLAEHGFKVRL
jgi:cyclase